MSSSSLSDAHLTDHGQQQHPQNAITAFLAKLWALVNDSTCDDLIAWDPSGGSFHVYDQARFAREILPRYFKHNNFASFIRQLNMYGFRKISTIEHGSLKNERDDIEFAHPSFIRGQDNLLESIKRRAPENQPKTSLPTIKTEIPATPMPAANHLGTPSTSESSTVRPVEFGQILTDVRNLKSKQSSLSDKLFHLEDENQALWREISLLRQKHAKQQQIVSKLMEFLLHILTNSTQNHRRSVEQPGGSATERTSAPHSTINLATHSLKRKPAALMHGDPPNKRPHPHHLQTPLDGLTPPQSIVINELSDTDTGLWAPIVTTMKNPSPVVDFVPSPPPSSSVQHRDEKYSPTQTTYEWIVPGDELLNNVSRPPTGPSRSLRTVENLHDKDETPFLPDFFLTTPDESNGFQNHDPISLNTLDSSRTSPSKHLSHLKEEEIELVNRFPPFPSSSTVNNNPNNDPGKLDNPSLSLDEFSSHVDSIQSSLDNIREFMFNKLPDGTSIDDLFDEEHVLLSPNFPATSNLLTDPIHAEDNKSNTDFLYADSSSHIPPMENHLLAQLMQHSTKIDEQRRASTRK